MGLFRSKTQGIFAAVPCLPEWPTLEGDGQLVGFRQVLFAMFQFINIPIAPQVLSVSSQESSFF